MTTISDAEMRIAVAKKLGWRTNEQHYGWSDELQRSCTDKTYYDPYGEKREILPDFPTRLDACEPVKKWLREHGYAIHTTNYITGKTSVTLSKTVFEDASSCEDSESRALCLAFLEVEG